VLAAKERMLVSGKTLKARVHVPQIAEKSSVVPRSGCFTERVLQIFDCRPYKFHLRFAGVP
jgi:hypothetical protein